MAKRITIAVLFLLFRPGPPAAHSTTLAQMNLRELALHAVYVARVRCRNTTTSADSNLVWTLTTFEVTEAWKGEPPPRFTIRLPGGEAAGRRVAVEGAPRFAIGEEVVLFLEPARGSYMNIVSWAQGTFRVRRNPHTGTEEAMQDTAGLSLQEPQAGKFSEGSRRSFTLAQLRSAVARAVAESGR